MTGNELINPFPGLRPFRTEEDYLFFGREEQTAELLALLREHRFLAVVGTSGSGKSSLVRAGLIPALHRGTMTQAGSTWEILLLRPGGNPLRNLAAALCDQDLYDSDDPETLPRVLATLRHSSMGLVDAYRQSDIEGGNCLVIVDQFEELFRFQQHDAASHDVASAFANLLLEASRQKECPVYVVLTMRSDYLGDCSNLQGLAEAVNEGEYLIPRLRREQLRSAIEGPVGVGGGTIAGRLVQHLLNDVGDDPDQLPILQHALMRTWDHWQLGRNEGKPLDLEHYEAVGGMCEALSRHADEIYDGLADDRLRLVAEKLFMALTERGADNRGIRRPTRLAQLGAIVNAEQDELTTVIDAFRKQGTFLMPMENVVLSPDRVIDISHESLMRVWHRLRHWVEEESQSARIYCRLAETAALHAQGKAGVYHDPDLQIASSWKETAEPTEAWAQRYHEGFAQAVTFLELSGRTQREQEEAREAARQRELDQAKRLAETERLRAVDQQRAAGRMKKFMAGLAVFAGIAAIASVLAIIAGGRAQENERLARQNAREAGLQGARARREATIAQQFATGAQRAREQTRRSLYFAQMNMAWQAAADPLGAGRLNELLTAWRPKSGETDLRGWEWYYLDSPRKNSLLTFRGHTGFLTTVTWSPDGTQLASAGFDNSIKVWNAQTGRELANLTGHIDNIWCVAWSPDGRWLASGSEDTSVRIWDASSLQEVHTINGHSGLVTTVSWSPNAARLASSSLDGTVRIWDRETGQLLQRYDGHAGQVGGVAWHPDGALLASSGSDMRIWRADTAEEVRPALRGHAGMIFGVAWSPDGKQLATAGGDSTVRIWNAETGQSQHTMRGHVQQVRHVCWNAEGTRVASAGVDRTIRLWNTESGEEVSSLRGHGHVVLSVRFGPDGTRLASASADRTVKLWEANPGPATPTLSGHSSRVRETAWSPDGTKLASVAADRSIRIWDALAMRQLVRLRPQAGPSAVCWSPDGQRIAIGDVAGNVVIWDARIGPPEGLQRLARLVGLAPNQRRQLTWRAHKGRVDSVKWSPDGKHIASGGRDQLVGVWDAETGEEFRTLRGHTGNVYSVDWSPDGKQLASGGGAGGFNDPRIIVWDVRGAEQVSALRGQNERVNAVAWSPDGRRLASGAGSQGFSFGSARGTVRVWDVTTEQEILTLSGHTAQVLTVCWSPDGNRLASGGVDTNIKIWDAASGQEMLTLSGHEALVRSLAWGPGGPRLASAGNDNTIKLWDATPGYELERSPKLLPVIDARIASGAVRLEDLRLRGEINARRGRWDEAAADFQKAAELQASDESAPSWFLTPWWVVGPYPEDLAAKFPPETSTDPFEPVAGVNPVDAPEDEAPPELQWEPINSDVGEGLDFANYFSRAEHMSVYAMMRIWSSREQDVGILAGSDDMMRLWLNGRLEHEFSTSRAARPDDDGVPVTLQPGWNTLLAKVVNLSGEHGLYLRLSTDPQQLAEAYERSDRWDDALEQWGHLVAAAPDEPRLRIARADLYARRELRAEAVADFATAMSLRPADATLVDGITAALAASALGQGALVPTSEQLRVQWRYTFATPPEGWQSTEFDDADWQSGPAPFGSWGRHNTTWSTDQPDIWLRREFDLDDSAAAIFLNAFVDDSAEIYLNGVLAAGATWVGDRYQRLDCSEESKAALRPGKNVVAVHCYNDNRGARIDAGLYSPRHDIVAETLSSALELTSNHPALLAKRGEYYAGRGAWQQAVDDYRKFAELDTAPIDDYNASTQAWERGAAVLARAGDVDAYREYCRKMLQRFAGTDLPYVAERTAKACLFFQPDESNRKAATMMADLAVTLDTTNWPWIVPFVQFAKGLAEYRRGNYEGAIEACRACLEHEQSDSFWFRTVQAHLVVAMARHRLGSFDQAREALDKASAILRGRSGEGDGTNWIICRTLQREALIQFSTSDEGDPQDDPARRLAVHALLELARSLPAAGHVERAKEAYEQAARQYERLLADDPANRDYRRGARDLAWLLVMLPDEHRPDAAVIFDFVTKAIPVETQDAGEATRWTVLHPTQMTSAGGATLTKLPDGSVLASGVSPDSDTYTITATTDLTGITALALEALPHPSLPAGGPGRHGGGNFELHDMRVTAAALAAPNEASPVLFQNATEDYAQRGASAARVIDNRPRSMWAVWPQVGQPHIAVFETAEDLGHPGGTQLSFTMQFHNPAWPKIPLGRFRLSVTTDPRPVTVEHFTLGDPALDMTRWTVLAAAFYRAGDFDGAVKHLEESINQTSGGTVYDWLLRSLVEYRLGRSSEAKPWYDKAVRWLDQIEPADPSLQRLRNDAALLVGLNAQANQVPGRDMGIWRTK